MPMHLSERFSTEGSHKHFKIQIDYITPVHFTGLYYVAHVSYMEMVLAFVSDYFI